VELFYAFFIEKNNIETTLYLFYNLTGLISKIFFLFVYYKNKKMGGGLMQLVAL
jgi:hypothetical protein